MKADKQKYYISNTLSISQSAFLLKFLNLTKVCDRTKELMISIYHIEKEHFLYFNEIFYKKFGDSSTVLLKKGWDFWFSLVDSKESIQIKNKVLLFFSNPQIHHTLILRYHITNLNKKKIYIRHEIFYLKLGKQAIAINCFFDVSDKEKIEHYLKLNKECKDYIFFRKHTNISPREKEVLELIADGFSSKQIADRLFISSHTVISHRKNLIEKFDVKNTAQLIKKTSNIFDV